MQIHTDYSGLQANGAPHVAPPPKRAAAAPLRDGDRSQEDRRQNQNGEGAAKDGRPVFRTLFTDATQAGLTAAASTTVREAREQTNAKPEFIRIEKRPEAGPVSLSDKDTNGLFAYIGAARQAAEASAAKITTPQAFIAATSKYAEQAAASANVFAGRGETLELQA